MSLFTTCSILHTPLTPNDSPENIPHLSQVQSANSVGTPGAEGGPRGSISGAPGQPGGPELHPTNSSTSRSSGSPVKESVLHRGMSVDEQDDSENTGDTEGEQGMPIRQ